MNYRIKGKVQGVGYRASAQGEAIQLGIAGWVRNLPDGSVEVAASGASQALWEFEQWLRRGPPQAVVTEVERHEIAQMLDDSKGFFIR